MKKDVHKRKNIGMVVSAVLSICALPLIMMPLSACSINDNQMSIGCNVGITIGNPTPTPTPPTQQDGGVQSNIGYLFDCTVDLITADGKPETYKKEDISAINTTKAMEKARKLANKKYPGCTITSTHCDLFGADPSSCPVDGSDNSSSSSSGGPGPDGIDPGNGAPQGFQVPVELDQEGVYRKIFLLNKAEFNAFEEGEGMPWEELKKKPSIVLPMAW